VVPRSPYSGRSLSAVNSLAAAQTGGGVITSYRDLAVKTRARVREFEEETRKMLHRDQAAKWDRTALDDHIARAKKDLEEDDLLDYLADNPSDLAMRRDLCGVDALAGPQEEDDCQPEDARGEQDLLSSIAATLRHRQGPRPSSPPRSPPPQGGRLFRDPSLHRPAPAPRKVNSASSGLRRSDSLTKSEKTEQNLKEKNERRIRELHLKENNLNNINRPYDKADNYSDSRLPLSSEFFKVKTPPKDFFLTNDHFLNQYTDSVEQKSESEQSAKVRRLSTDVRSRRHNVQELKEKFEGPQYNNEQQSQQHLQPQQLHTPSSRPGPARKGRGRSRIKRRHTVGGTKDLTQEHTQAKLQRLRESLTASDLLRERLEPWCGGPRGGSKERRASVVEPLRPLLESHV